MSGGWLSSSDQQFTEATALNEFLLFLADDALILGQQLSKWCSNGPELEQDIAIINTALDHIGRARLLYQEVAKRLGSGTTEDTLAYHRDHMHFRNLLLCEQKNGHWGDSIVRSFFLDTFNFFLFSELRHCSFEPLSGIAEKSLKEIAYHAQWSAEWVVRLGDGTELSHNKVQKSINDLWMWCGELFEDHTVFNHLPADFPQFKDLKSNWLDKIDEVLTMATLERPTEEEWHQTGGRKGVHTANLGFILAEMQFLPRAYPDAQW